ncbi:MAG: GNAT family N-acetyltransferase [Fibrobacteres bacterium]|nr:GNAT family N-acetyltransferase [Fibrobacterota bacterium]
MDGLEFKRIGLDEIDLLVKSRIDYCMRDNPSCTKEEYDLFNKSVEDWTRENAKSGNYIGYIGCIDNEIVSFAGLLMYVLPPLLKNSNRKQGHVLSFFTYPKYRSKGIGNEMMKFMIADAKTLNISQLVLSATPMGEPLYKKNGFTEPKMKYMTLDV